MLLWLTDRSRKQPTLRKSSYGVTKPLHAGGSNPDGSLHDYGGSVFHSGCGLSMPAARPPLDRGLAHDARVPMSLASPRWAPSIPARRKSRRSPNMGATPSSDRYVPHRRSGRGCAPLRSERPRRDDQIAPTVLKLLDSGPPVNSRPSGWKARGPAGDSIIIELTATRLIPKGGGSPTDPRRFRCGSHGFQAGLMRLRWNSCLASAGAAALMEAP